MKKEVSENGKKILNINLKEMIEARLHFVMVLRNGILKCPLTFWQSIKVLILEISLEPLIFL